MTCHRPRAFFLVVALIVLAWPAAAQTPTPTPTPIVVDPTAAFFDDTVVQEIRLTINSRDWQSLQEHYLENDYYPCDFRWNGQTVRNIGIRSRGTGSRSAGKPGLRVDFDRYTTDQTFLGLRSVILRNQSQDASNMHERISMLLFKRLGVKVMREAFTKLFVNNSYAGLYTIVESVDKAFLKKAFGENDGDLYKYDYPADAQPWYFADRGTDPALYVPLTFKPETNETTFKSAPIVQFVRIVANDSDAAFPTTVAPYVDWDNFTRHIAIESVLADLDGFNGDYGINNFYWYRLQNKNQFVWIPWDKSEAFKGGSTYPIFHNFLDGVPGKRNRLSGRAMTLSNVQSMYLDRLLDAAKSLRELDDTTPSDSRGWMEREIQREYDQIRDLVDTDTTRQFTNAEFEADVERLRTFARERPAFVEQAVADWRKPR